MHILIIDNFDSFTYNLVHYCQQFADEVTVIRNNEKWEETAEKCDKIILSPGPGLPSDVESLNKIIIKYSGVKPILGVCLGHQAIAEAFGGEIFNMSQVHHGIPKETTLLVNDDYLFEGVPTVFESGRYHSWAVKVDNLPETISITAKSDDGTIMALSHKQFDTKGIQFHPESVLTPYGLKIIENWVKHK